MGVEKHPLGVRVLAFRVSEVAQDGVADLMAMDTKLMAATSMRLEKYLETILNLTELGKFVEDYLSNGVTTKISSFQHHKLGHRLPGLSTVLFVAGTHLDAFPFFSQIMTYVQFNEEPVLLDVMADDGEIELGGFSELKGLLRSLVGFGSQGNYEDAGSRVIQTVDDAKTKLKT